MTITVARNGISLIASRTSRLLLDVMKTRSVGVSTVLLETTRPSLTGYASGSVGVLKCQSTGWSRAYSDKNAPSLTHRPSDFDKKILVWSKTYPSIQEIPEIIPHGKMKRAKDVFRIRVNIWMAVATVFGCVVMIAWGRKAAREGQSVAKENMLWHKSIQDKADAEKAEAEKPAGNV